ncbi:MAG TPA: hypothetical protein VFE62_18170 [Gemmataceae bacterium]|nr:hypothetical protein [Gemmataceae bacterium]
MQLPLDAIPLWLYFTLIVAVCLLAIESGYRFGRWRHQRAAEEKDAPVGAMVAAILGLLAFMLAFTFSLAATRFDLKRQAVLEEANAIGTTYLRTRLLPEPQRDEIADLLREYVDLRLRGVNEGNVAETVAGSEKIQTQLWSKAIEASKNKEANPVLTALFLQSLNETIDLHAKRVQVGVRNRIPSSIWFSLFALAVISMTAIGYQSGLCFARRSPAMLGLALAFAGILYLIADLDRGREGFLVVSQQALVDVQKSMKSPSP